MTDHKLGFPPVAAEAAHVAEFPDWRDYVYSYPLGIPNRAVEEAGRSLEEIISCLTDEPGVVAFESGDHHPDGSIRERVTDAEIMRGVSRNMGAIHDRAALLKFHDDLCDRLQPLRTPALLDQLGKVYELHAQRIADGMKPKSRVSSAAAAPGISQLVMTPQIVAAAQGLGSCGLGVSAKMVEENAKAVEEFEKQRAAQSTSGFIRTYTHGGPSGLTFWNGGKLGD